MAGERSINYLPETFKGAVAITPSDSVDLADPVSGIYCGGTGNITVDMVDGTNVTFTAVQVGSVLKIAATRVYSTGTSATGLVGLK